MHWLMLILLLVGIATAVPMLDEATELEPDAALQSAVVASAGEVRVPADLRGHFMLQAVIAGRDLELMADTGASAVVLTEDDARRAGFNPASLDYGVPVRTANGTAYAAAVILPRVEVGHIVVRDVEALVAKPEALHQSLLGMTFLKRLREFSVRDGTLVLVD